MNNLEIETRYYTPALIELGMWLTEEQYRKMNAVIVCGPPDSPDPDSMHAKLQHTHTVTEPGPMKNSESTWEHKDNEIREETSAVIPADYLYRRFFDDNVDITGLMAAPDSEKSESEIIDVCGLTTSFTDFELPDYETMMTDEPKAPNPVEVESDYIDVCILSTSLTSSELPGYEIMVADEPLEMSHHYSEKRCSFDESTDYSDDDSEESDVSSFSPNQQFTSTPETPQHRIYMLAPYIATPTTSSKRLCRRHLNFRDPNVIYDLSDITDDENVGDESAAKRLASDDCITHNGTIAEWVNDIVQLYRLRGTTCASVQC